MICFRIIASQTVVLDLVVCLLRALGLKIAQKACYTLMILYMFELQRTFVFFFLLDINTDAELFELLKTENYQ